MEIPINGSRKKPLEPIKYLFYDTGSSIKKELAMFESNRKLVEFSRRLLDLTLSGKLVWGESGVGFAAVVAVGDKRIRIELQHVEGPIWDLPHNTQDSPLDSWMCVRDDERGDPIFLSRGYPEICNLLSGVEKRVRKDQKDRGVAREPNTWRENYDWLDSNEFSDLRKKLENL